MSFSFSKTVVRVAFIALVAAPLASTRAAFVSGVVNGDFDAGTGTYTGQGALATTGSVWNSLNEVSFDGNKTYSNLLDSQGFATDVTVTTANGNGNNSLGLTPPSNDPEALFQDYYFNTPGDPGDTDSVITFAGLTPGAQYALYLYDGITASTFTVDGVSKALPVNFNRAVFVEGENYARFDTTAGATGEVIATISLGDGDRRGFSGFQIAAVPEPAMLGVAGLGAIALVKRRRRTV